MINQEQCKESEKLEAELSRYALIKNYYTENRGREKFNSPYLLMIADRLTEVSFFDKGVPWQLQKKSDELLAFFAKKSRYI